MGPTAKRRPAGGGPPGFGNLLRRLPVAICEGKRGTQPVAAGGRVEPGHATGGTDHERSG
jgi:hypothetical protein